VRDYIHVEDLASAHHLALSYIMKNNASDIFNLGTGNGFSNKEVVSAILTEGKKNNINGEIVFKPRRQGDAAALFANNSKAKKILGWDPKYSHVADVVKTAFNFHLKHK